MNVLSMRIWGARALFWFVISYVALLLLLATVIPLWLDEILTLIGSTQPTLAALLDYIRTVPGGTPLAFLPARLTIATLGSNLLASRLPSILASAAALPGVFLLARHMNLRTPLAAVAIFALWPLQLRYALEARPYALALCFTVWLTVLILDDERPLLYVTLTILAALTQPYALFVPAAHLTHRRKFPLIALTVATVILIPWYAYFRGDWSHVIQDQNLVAFDTRAPLVLLHEISGSGYIGLAILATGACFARRAVPLAALWLWAIIPIALTLIANTAFHYFFATRQVIYILPALALLFAAGTERLGKPGCVLLAAFLTASLYENGRWFTRPHESWQAAAEHATAQLAPGSCIQFTGDSVQLFYYFRPELKAHRCTPELADRVILAITPYREEQDYPRAAAGLTAHGLRKQSEQSFNGPRVEVWTK